MDYDAACLSVSNKKDNEDRVVNIQRGATRLIVVADGAGGIEGGATAAQLSIAAITGSRMIPTLTRQPSFWENTLSMLDAYIFNASDAGECAVVIAAIVDGHLVGASVGDAGARLFTKAEDHNLTSAQHVKPLLGSAVAEAVPFGPIRFDGTLVVGSDGLFKYATVDAIRERCTRPSADEIDRTLIELVKLPSGDYHDDTTVAVCKA